MEAEAKEIPSVEDKAEAPESASPVVNRASGDSDKSEEKTLTQKEFHEALEARMKQEADKRQRAADKAAKEAEANAAKQRGEWEAIAKGHESTIAELNATVAEMDALKAEVERVNKALNEQLKADRKLLPPHIIELLDKLAPVDQLLYIAKNRATLGGTNGNVGLPQTPDANGVDKLVTDEEKKRRLAESADYLRKVM